MAIYQDLVDRFGFSHRYNSVKRFCRHLKPKLNLLASPNRFPLAFKPFRKNPVAAF